MYRVEFLLRLLIFQAIFSLSIEANRSIKVEKRFSSHWIMKMNVNDVKMANRLVQEHNFKLVRHVGMLEGYYVIESDHHRTKRSANVSVSSLVANSLKNMSSHPMVDSIEKEEVIVRQKRDFIEFPIEANLKSDNLNSNKRLLSDVNKQHGLDPFWSEMWYLNRNLGNSNTPDMNVTGAWALGYTGRGVTVTFLDDGLEWTHPDIIQNYDPKASVDLNGNDNDPTPRYDETNENKHGTRCAGEVAGAANNSICGVGVAFNAKIGGIRMLDGDVTDSVEASSLGLNSQHVDIYSASWGPSDNGEVVDGPGPLARRALMEGAAHGRKGLGSIFIWASGNGGRFNDSCACDGYANSIYTISIGSTSERGERPWFLEDCASTLATTYSSGDEKQGEKEIITTDIQHKCTSKHTGTSAAAPLAAGAIALTLEANPRLTWRDVMYLIVLTSRPQAIKANKYIINKRGFKVSPSFGFGLMDAGRMVQVAKDWVNVPPMVSCVTFNSRFNVRTVHTSKSVQATLHTDACANTINEVNFIEQVEVIVTVKALVRGNLEIYLTSPMGTKSQILPRRTRDMSSDGFKRWPFMSVHLWGEKPRGEWKITITSFDGSLVTVEDYQLVIHGTRQKPVDYEKFIGPEQTRRKQPASGSRKYSLKKLNKS